MQRRIEGKVYVLGDNIDTDQIIPAQYLTYNPSIPAEYKMFGKYALSGVPDDAAGLPKGHVPFHGPAEFYARIFYRNAVNGGYLIPLESKARLIDQICTGDEVALDLDANTITNKTTGDKWELLPLGEVAPIIEAGEIFPYAEKAGMLKK